MKGTKKRWAICLISGAILLQTTTCGSLGDLATALGDANRTQLANIVSDVVFFFLDNAFVRLTT